MGDTGWFHCGRCGALFSLLTARGAPDSCPECGRNPVVAESEMEFEAGVAIPGAGRVGEPAPERRRKKAVNPESKGGGFRIFALIWGVGALLVVGVVQWVRRDIVEEGEEKLAVRMMTPNERLLHDNIVACRDTLAAFLANASPEHRAEHVLNGSEILGRMVRHQQENPTLTSIGRLELEQSGIFETPAGLVIETLWKLEDGQLIEATYREEGGAWKIDWDALVRFSTVSWPVFLNVGGEDEGTFRLLARRRVQVDEEEDGMVILLMEPLVGEPGGTGAQSGEIAIEKGSRTERILNEAFERKEAGDGIYGSTWAENDPLGMVRLRVKLRRGPEDDKGVHQLSVLEIPACHWLGIDDLGLEE